MNFKILSGFIFVCLLYVSPLSAQKVIMDEEPVNDKEPVIGPNLKHYYQSHTSLSFFVDEAAKGATVKYGPSLELITGNRYKYKLNGAFAIGGELNYHFRSYSMSQDVNEPWPDTIYYGAGVLHDKEKFDFHALSLGAFFRINFDPKRGNNLGHFIDIGGMADYFVYTSYVFKDKARDGAKRKVRYSQLPFVSPFQLGCFARIGFNKFSLFGAYRFTDQFKKDYNFPELPRLSVGLEIAP